MPPLPGKSHVDISCYVLWQIVVVMFLFYILLHIYMYRGLVGLRRKKMENYLDAEDAGTTVIPGEHSVL